MELGGRQVPGFGLGQAPTPEAPDWPNLRTAVVYWWTGTAWTQSGVVGTDPSNAQLKALLNQNLGSYRWAWIVLDTSQQPCGVIFPPSVTAVAKSTMVFNYCTAQ